MKRRVRNKLKKRYRQELVRAIYEGHFEKVKRLVQSNSDANYKDEGGWTPLHWATQERKTEIIQFLLSKGADINDRDYEGFSPLYQAASEGRIELVQFLLNNKQ